VLQGSGERTTVKALETCSIGTIDNENVDQVLRKHPVLGLALWRAALIDAGILRQWFAIMRRPALQRVAHLLSEQLARRTGLGINDSIIPLNQVEIADATGLSVVHTNRIFQDLRRRGVLSKVRQTVEVASRARLQELAVFDSRYLRSEEPLARWHISIDD
jgi:CRP-like cAMP-binding protein